MKKHILSAVAILVIGLGISSCSDYLSVERFFKDRQSEEKIFKSKNFTEQWLAKCYNCLLETNLEITRIGYSTTNFADDMIFNESDGAVTYNAFKFGQYDNTWTNNSYIRCYEGIRQASILINNIDINEELSEVEIADYKAQARFLRSYFYWLLLRKYGPVPLIPEETISIDEDYMDMSYPRSSYDEVVNYISEEMALAARSLPEKRDRQNVNRSTKGAALAVRAKVLLYTASPINNPRPGDSDKFSDFTDWQGRMLMSQTYDESKWARAAAAAKDVIDLANATGVYKLYTAPYQSKGDNAYPATVRPPYHSVYSNKDFPEGWADIDPFASYRSIFNGDLYATENPELIFTRGNNALNDQVRDLVLDHLPTNAGGRNRHGLTIKQCDAYDMADGSSFNLETFLDTCEVDKRFVSEDEYNRGLYPQIRPRVWKEYANREPRFYADITFSNSKWFSGTEGDYTVDFTYSGNCGKAQGNNDFTSTGYLVRKNMDSGDRNQNLVCVLLRLTNIYFDYIEALAYVDPSHADIWKYMNLIRERAGIPGYGTASLPKATTTSEIMKLIQKEKRIELSFENCRYFDVRRWGLTNEFFNKPVHGMNVNYDGNEFYKRTEITSRNFDRQYFFPIPQSEIDIDKNLVQNEGF